MGDGYGDVGPIGAEPATEAIGIVAGAEVVVAGFGVALFAFELVVVGRRTAVGIGVFAAVGIEVGVVGTVPLFWVTTRGGAEEVFRVVFGIAASGEHGDALAAKENVFVQGVARGIGFGEDFAAGAVPIELAARFGNAATGAVVEVVDATSGFDLRFGVVRIATGAVILGVAGEVVAEDGKVVVAISRSGEAAFFGAAGVIGIGRGSDAIEIAPGIEGVTLAPAVSRARGVGGGGQRAGYAV